MAEVTVQIDANAVVLVPGDKVLLATTESLTDDAVEGVMGQLDERFPGVEFTLVAPISSIAVQEKTDG